MRSDQRFNAPSIGFERRTLLRQYSARAQLSQKARICSAVKLPPGYDPRSWLRAARCGRGEWASREGRRPVGQAAGRAAAGDKRTEQQRKERAAVRGGGASALQAAGPAPSPPSASASVGARVAGAPSASSFRCAALSSDDVGSLNQSKPWPSDVSCRKLSIACERRYRLLAPKSDVSECSPS